VKLTLAFVRKNCSCFFVGSGWQVIWRQYNSSQQFLSYQSVMPFRGYFMVHVFWCTCASTQKYIACQRLFWYIQLASKNQTVPNLVSIYQQNRVNFFVCLILLHYPKSVCPNMNKKNEEFFGIFWYTKQHCCNFYLE